MDYIAHTVDTAAAVGSVADLLWAAADLVATHPETADPIHDAGLHLIAAGRTTARRAGAAVELATMIAASRHPDLAAAITGDDTDWASWQQVLTEPWPILADAAAFAAKLGGLEGHITPGRWIA
ncbi:hypothetical protein QBL07_024465 (plasmid) [Gordonia rubripertincta]|uniref:DUF222 domain-containing protein n=2 Tax=Gordonia rubripertincta TaxID=36822 RepID=A0AAW6RFL8_GORRU|nr:MULTISPECIES: hypothetical protein [Gordonia]MDG6783140.1 hypothetical protein [Gordonia rubripertincta]NKY65449.1 hypothetical protein [Gordonia rubripertincta]GAB86892.1 hypothetical protein GORBP_083_00430 [Gordonia rubripertincta NBRC 101908]